MAEIPLKLKKTPTFILCMKSLQKRIIVMYTADYIEG